MAQNDDEIFTSWFRHWNDYGVRQGCVSAFPNFYQTGLLPGGINNFGTILVPPPGAGVSADQVLWRDITAIELRGPGFTEARFRSVANYAAREGFVGGYPNFYEAINANGLVYGVILFRSEAAQWQDIPATELRDVSSPEARFRSTHDWAIAHGFAAGFPNFHETDHGAGRVFGTVLIRNGYAQWRDVSGVDLGIQKAL